jgi:DNA (cytosine-5)-methyltransferase 1
MREPPRRGMTPDPKRLTVGSLFSGIGGFDLAAERVGWEIKWQVEIDPFCRRVLEKHWPHVRRYEDVRTVGVELGYVDVLCGGFPCQDLSSAGKRAGIDGERSGLWRDAVRIIAELRPRCVVLENVYQAWRRWVPVLRRTLWDLGYASLPIRVRASDFGAWHQRSRAYLVAHVDASALRLESWRGGWPNWSCPPLFADAGESGLWQGVRLLRARESDAARCAGAEDADADQMWELQPEGSQPDERRWARDRGWRATEPDLVRVVHGVSSRLDGRRMAARIGGLGNAVFAPAVEWIFRQIQAADAD